MVEEFGTNTDVLGVSIGYPSQNIGRPRQCPFFLKQSASVKREAKTDVGGESPTE